MSQQTCQALMVKHACDEDVRHYQLYDTHGRPDIKCWLCMTCVTEEMALSWDYREIGVEDELHA
jgi:hypothetical protein